MKIRFLLLLPLFLLLTGCFDYTELNELSIVSGVSIDIKDDEYLVGFLITNAINPNSNNDNHATNTTLLSGKGKTITDAINDIDSKNPKRYYLGHMSSLIVSKEVANDMKKVIDYFFRNPESIKKFYIVVSEENAIDSLKIISPQEIFPSENIISNLKEVSDLQSISSETLYSEFINDILIEGKEPLTSTIKIVGNVDNADDKEDLDKTDISTSIKVSSMAIFKEYQLVELASVDESKGINLINNDVNELYLKIKCDNGFMLSNINNINTKTSYKIIDNNIKFFIKINGSINIQETNCDYDLNNNNIKKKIVKKYEKELENVLDKGVNAAKRNKSDIFGFGNKVYKYDFNYWEKNKDNWDNIFSSLDINYNIDLKLVSFGSALNTMEGLINNE